MKNIYDVLVNKTKNYLQEIIDISDLTEVSWNQIDDKGFSNTKYIFKNSDNELIISNKGDVKIFKWEYLNAVQAILIREEKTIQLYNKAFLSKDLIVLKKDSIEEYLLLVSQEKIKELENENNYLEFNKQIQTNPKKLITQNPEHKIEIIERPYTARKEKEAMNFGIIMIIIWSILLLTIGPINNNNYGLNEQQILLIVSVIFRLISVSWISGISKRLKRSSLGWSLFAFFFPSFALIIIGNLSNKNQQ